MTKHAHAHNIFREIYNQGPTIKEIISCTYGKKFRVSIKYAVDHDTGTVRYSLTKTTFEEGSNKSTIDQIGIYPRLLFAIEALEDHCPEATRELDF